MKAALLFPIGGVVKVSGEDARNFLNGLVTTDMTLVRPGLGRFGALLTPQGKITVDFLITEAPSGHGGGFLIDCPRALAQALADKLGFYKLRAKVAVENLSDSLRRARRLGRRFLPSSRTLLSPIRAMPRLAGGSLFRPSSRKRSPI